MLAPTLSESFVRKLEGINGWLAPQAAEFTAYLFQSGLRGNVVEFGVFHGKYLAALYYLTATLQSRVLGVDAFFGSADVDISQQVIIENIREACGDSDRLSLFCANTMSLKRDDVLKLLIALDDAFNYTTPGAVEGTCRYFEQNNNARIAPFAHCYNKLFITSAEHHSYFLEITNRYLHENKTRDYCANTLRLELRCRKNRVVRSAFQDDDRA
jgi:hypothetical protein